MWGGRVKGGRWVDEGGRMKGVDEGGVGRGKRGREVDKGGIGRGTERKGLMKEE